MFLEIVGWRVLSACSCVYRFSPVSNLSVVVREGSTDDSVCRTGFQVRLLVGFVLGRKRCISPIRFLSFPQLGDGRSNAKIRAFYLIPNHPYYAVGKELTGLVRSSFLFDLQH